MNWLKRIALAVVAAPLLAEPAATIAADGGAQRDYLVVVSRPNMLNVIDLQSYEITHQCPVPGPSMAVPGTLVLSPDASVAYILAEGFAEVYGIRISDCEMVFSTRQSSGAERVRSIGAIAMSADGKRIYTHQNPVMLHSDRYEVQPTRVAIFDTAAGLDTPPLKTLPAPRQVTIMGAGADGTLYLGGRDVYAMDPETGDIEIAIHSASLNDPKFALRDVLTVWNIGADAGEFYRMYSSAEYTDDSQNLETARWHWGFERVDLATGETESEEFGPLEEVLFTSIRRPGNPDQIYAVLNNLVKFDASEKKILDSQSLNHSYYCINFTADGSKVVLAGAANEVAVHDADTLEKLGSVILPGDMSMSSTQLFRASSPAR